jgi:signal transduction histidine kinase
MVSTLVNSATDRGLDATYDGPEHLEVRLRISGMRRAVSNLIENALHYGDRAEVTLSGQAGGGVLLTVADRGPGIPPEQFREVLQPFSRLDEARARNTGGLGMGLAIVATAVEREGGELALANRPDGGLIASITLPPAAQAQQ